MGIHQTEVDGGAFIRCSRLFLIQKEKAIATESQKKTGQASAPAVELEDIKLLHAFEESIRDIKDADNSGGGIPKSILKRLNDYLDDHQGGYKGPKQLTGTGREVIKAAAQAAPLIKKMIEGENVAVNACRVALDIAGPLIGAAIPPP